MAIDQAVLERMIDGSAKDLETLVNQVASLGPRITLWTEDDTLYKAIQDKIKTDFEAYIPTKISVAFSSCTIWTLSTSYSSGNFVKPSSYNGYIYECTAPGLSSISEPTWPLTPGDTVVDNGVTWTCREMSFQTGAGYGTTNLTSWWLGSSTEHFYEYLGVGWDSDATITEYISNWNIIYPLITSFPFGTTAMLNALNTGLGIIQTRKTQIENRNPILPEYVI